MIIFERESQLNDEEREADEIFTNICAAADFNILFVAILFYYLTFLQNATLLFDSSTSKCISLSPFSANVLSLTSEILYKRTLVTLQRSVCTSDA